MTMVIFIRKDILKGTVGPFCQSKGKLFGRTQYKPNTGQ
jgi:hypothetical protein